MYDKGLPSLPDDILCEIFCLLDMEALKSCSLTGKALSCSAKSFIHRTLYLIPRPSGIRMPKYSGPWNEFEGLSTLSERDLLQHTRHISIFLPHRKTLFVRDLAPHIQHLRKITNLRSLKTCWLDVPSFIPKMEDYFGAFLGSLRSLELEHPRGDHKEVLYFACQFQNLRDLKVNGLEDYFHSMRVGGPQFEIKTSPPLDGTLDLQMNLNPGSKWRDLKGPQLLLSNLLTLPSGLKFRTIKLSRCTGDNLQLLIDVCAPTLECMALASDGFGKSFHQGDECSLFTFVRTISLSGAPHCPPLSFKRHPALRELEISLTERARLESAAGWLSETLSTITSNAFTKLTISISLVSFLFRAVGDDYVRGWNSVDDVLDQLNRCEDVTLVAKMTEWVKGDNFGGVIEEYFPLMWVKGRVVLEVPPPTTREVALKRIY